MSGTESCGIKRFEREIQIWIMKVIKERGIGLTRNQKRTFEYRIIVLIRQPDGVALLSKNDR